MARPPAFEVPFFSKRVLRGDYYVLDLEPPPDAELAVTCGGRELCGSDYDVDRHSFRYHSVEYVDSGSGRLSLEGRQFPLRPGSLFRYGPGVPHRIGADGAPPMVKYFVDFAGTAATRLLRCGPWSELRPLHAAEPTRLRELFDELQSVGRRPTANAARLCALLLEQILLVAADEALPQEAGEAAASDTFRRCRRYIESQYLGLVSLAQVADACDVSEAHLCRLFQRYASESPYRLLVRLKMARAASLLLDRGLRVREVGLRVGYDDPYHFSKVFKRVYGLSPEAFRSRGRGWPTTIEPARFQKPMAETPSTMLPLGTQAPDFRLPDTEGQSVALADFARAKALVVMFLCNHCPYVKHVQAELVRLASEYQSRGVAMVAISSNDTTAYPEDGPAAMKAEKARVGYPFPYLFDETQEVAKAYRAACTPDLYLFDSGRRLVYRGQLDDSRPGRNVPVTGYDLRKALDAVLEARPVDPEQHASIGCNIKWRPGNEPSYFGR